MTKVHDKQIDYEQKLQELEKRDSLIKSNSLKLVTMRTVVEDIKIKKQEEN